MSKIEKKCLARKGKQTSTENEKWKCNIS